MKAFCTGLPGAIVVSCQSTRRSGVQASIAMLVSSVPLSETQVRGLPDYDDRVQLASDAPAGDRGIGNQRQAFASEVVDHGEDAEPPTIGERVGDEVE
jgi:hypothetical protein